MRPTRQPGGYCTARPAKTDLAERLHGSNPDFRFVRQLMPGGTCESTAYAAFGHTATGLCLPMENYHNQGADGRIAPEVINLSDFACLVE